MKRNVETKNRKLPVALALILLALALILFEEGRHQEEPQRDPARDERAQQLINQHMQETNRQLLMKDTKALIDNQKALIEAKKSRPQIPFKHNPNRLEIAEYQEHHDFNEEVGRTRKNFSVPNNPSDLVQTELFHDQQEKKYSDAYKKEYARQFVENAKREGWDIQLDTSFRIISVRPLERKPSTELFEGSGSNGSGRGSR